MLSVAGSEGMAGAATLCARSALRAGAGLVTAACPFAVLNTVQAQAPCATAKVVADGASLDAGAADMLKELAEHKAALAVGPGLGREEGAWLAIEALVKSDIPKVIDADALFLLAKHGGGVGANTVLTPHPGEMARLCGMTTQAVLAAPVETAQQLAADLGACVLLKGATTVIAQGEDVAMNVTGCDGMGTGGRAAVDGTMTAGMAQSLLKAGIGFESTLKMINSAMLAKGGEESLATLDVACIDLFTGHVSLRKAGAAGTVLRRRKKTEYLEAKSVPVGILPEIACARS